MIIDYIRHSGFLVETDRLLLLFDYFRGDLSALARAPAEKPLFVFVSHAHPDHFNTEIFSLAGQGRSVRYLLSFDLRRSGEVPPEADVLYLDADETYEIDGLGTVQTFLSTDEGVAFAVDTGEARIFHAGDLHWWDWPGEDPGWLAEQERVFKREVEKLALTPPDVAFVVLDGRLEDRFAKGMLWLLSACRPAVALPMHFWKDRDIIERFRALPEAQALGTQILDTAHETHWELCSTGGMQHAVQNDP